MRALQSSGKINFKVPSHIFMFIHIKNTLISNT